MDINYKRNKATISQLKNSGSMRLVRKRNVADSILAYEFTKGKAHNPSSLKTSPPLTD